MTFLSFYGIIIAIKWVSHLDYIERWKCNLENVRDLFFEDVKEKSLIARSSRTTTTKLPICSTYEETSTEIGNTRDIRTVEEFEQLSPQEQLEWLELIQKNPGFKKQAEIMGIKYYWFYDRKNKLKRELDSKYENKVGKMNGDMEQALLSHLNNKLKAIENKLLNQVNEALKALEDKLLSDGNAVNSTIKSLDLALKELRDIIEADRNSVTDGYFINRELDADTLSKRLAKLSDSIGITDSRYKVFVRIVEIDDTK